MRKGAKVGALSVPRGVRGRGVGAPEVRGNGAGERGERQAGRVGRAK